MHYSKHIIIILIHTLELHLQQRASKDSDDLVEFSN